MLIVDIITTYLFALSLMCNYNVYGNNYIFIIVLSRHQNLLAITIVGVGSLCSVVCRLHTVVISVKLFPLLQSMDEPADSRPFSSSQ